MTKIKDNPTVSVIIPTHNRAHMVGRAIQSVLNQTYQDFEIIVVDDGSTDNTEEVVKSFTDERVKYIRLEQNSGGSAAPRNAGLKVARGEYIAFLDSDDEWLPEKLEKQIDKFQILPSNVGVVYSGFSIVSERTGQIVSTSIPTLRGEIHTDLLDGCHLSIITSLTRKDCFQKAGYFDETLLSCQDWDIWIRLSRYYEFDFIPDILAKFHVHGGQTSLKLDAINVFIQGKEQIIGRYQADFLKNTSALAKQLERLAVLHCLAGHSREGRRYFLALIKRRPFKKGGYVHFLLSLLAPERHRNILRKYCVPKIDGITFYR